MCSTQGHSLHWVFNKHLLHQPHQEMYPSPSPCWVLILGLGLVGIYRQWTLPGIKCPFWHTPVIAFLSVELQDWHLGMVAFACNPSTQEAESGGSQIWSQHRLHTKSQASLSSVMKPWLKNKQTNKNKKGTLILKQEKERKNDCQVSSVMLAANTW